MTIRLFRYRDKIGAIIGPNVQVSISGWGDTAVEALRDLAAAIERDRYPLPELDRPAQKPVLVK
jgi:hypothetical protein